MARYFLVISERLQEKQQALPFQKRDKSRTWSFGVSGETANCSERSLGAESPALRARII